MSRVLRRVSAPPRRIGIVGHPRYAALHDALTYIIDFGIRRGIELLVQPDLLADGSAVPPVDECALAELDLLITMGGDGTLLRGARMVAPYGIPVLGINLGHLGFLTSLAPGELEDGLEALASGDIVLDERMALTVRAEGENGAIHLSSIALNDAVLHRGGVARMIRMAVFAHDEEVGTYSADGIILATPTGSTAYSLSAGGPIVSPGVDCIVATPISPHTLGVRPLILSGDEVVTVEVLSPTEELILTIDGQESVNLIPGDRLIVERAPQPLRLIRFPGQTFFSTLRRKLGWGDLEERSR